MSSVNVYHCQRCVAPLEVPPGNSTIVCRYCGTYNELRPPGAPGTGAAAPAAAPPNRALVAILIGIAVVVAMTAVVALLVPRGARVLGALRGPLELEWSNERKFVVKSDESRYGEVAIFEGRYQITLHGFPEGTKWKVAEKSGRVESAIYNIVKLENVEDQFGKIPVAKYRDYLLGPKAKLELELPSGQASIELRQVDAAMSVLSVLERVKNGPVLFEGEPKKDSSQSNVVLLDTASMKLFGPAVLLQDVDQVAMTRRLPEIKGRKTCAGYKDREGKPLPDLMIRFKETEATVFDRRTGIVVQKKVFPPEEACPMFSFMIGGARDREREQDSYPPTQDIEAWLSSLVQR
jgi:hypothetical protein